MTVGAEITLQSVADVEEGEASPEEGKASPMRTRRSVTGDLEMESGLIGYCEWLISNGSSATVSGFRYFFCLGFSLFDQKLQWVNVFVLLSG